ncbi:MAG: site-specific DNA-methyltransferase [Candidatus Saganbacteria bacterium]|nr:site-specific DNA-methyltransferase [Candidatus Saganbacteria bacterium]
MTKHYLIHGDAIEVLPKIQNKVDAIIVDPPYNTSNKNTKVLKGRKARTSDFGAWDYYSDEEYLRFTRKWIILAQEKLKAHGNFLIFCKLEYVSDVRRIYESEGLKHHGTIIWHKTNPAPQIRKKGFLSSCEAILWATNGFDDNKISYAFNFSTQREMHNFIETPICMGRERTPHPTQKPKKVLSHLLNIFTNENDWILDCFAGSGTLAEAASEIKRNTINIESDNNYFNIMAKRIQGGVNSKVKIVTSVRNLGPLKL